MLGYDAAYVRDQDGVAAWREAVRTGRTLLTRRRDLGGRAGVDVLVIEDDDVLDQLVAVARRFGLGLTAAAMTRCVECNVVLREVTKGEVRDRLPPHVQRTQDRFMACPECGRVYWPGTHYARAVARLSAALRTAAGSS